MELTFSGLRAKEVINVQDGRRLGRVCDIVLCYPENKWIGIVVPSVKGFSFKKENVFIDLKSINKIGEDVILVNVGMPKKACAKNACPPPQPRQNQEYSSQNYGDRNFDEYE